MTTSFGPIGGHLQRRWIPALLYRFDIPFRLSLHCRHASVCHEKQAFDVRRQFSSSSLLSHEQEQVSRPHYVYLLRSLAFDTDTSVRDGLTGTSLSSHQPAVSTLSRRRKKVNIRRRHYTYVGYSLDPWRRLRQHNGELASGARRTLFQRPWQVVLLLRGFRSKSEALQFEWAWQHPGKSLRLRPYVTNNLRRQDVPGRISCLIRMLQIEPYVKHVQSV